jgi:hypothetical protein
MRMSTKKPQDLIEHSCINLRLPTYGGLYAWEFEKGNRELMASSFSSVSLRDSMRHWPA